MRFPFDPAYLIFGATIVAFVLFQLNLRLASPVLAIVNRWLRWLIFATGGALVIRHYGWLERPYWALASGLFLAWFLGETLYHWLAVKALSLSQLPLFPRFTLNTTGEEWPANPRLLKLREWLRTHHLRQVQALKAEIGPGVYLRVSVYQDEVAHTRVQLAFLPQVNGTITVCCSLSTQTVSGYRYVTDNLFLPFGGFYPENWLVARRPWNRSLPKLLAHHQARLAGANELPLAWTTEPLTDLNAQQRELDQVNTELGFLWPQAEREDHGKMTYEGRYRVWKEIWLLNYLGRSARYE
jgi:hypothetical protein